MSDPRNILIVDDDEDILLFLKESVNDIKGVEVHTATDGIEALAMLEKVNIDLLITDICMPNLDGIALIGRIKSSDTPPPIIVSTGNEDSLKEARSLDVDGFFEKPFKVKNLVERIKDLLKL